MVFHFYMSHLREASCFRTVFTLSCTCDKETSINPNAGVWEEGKHGRFWLVAFFNVTYKFCFLSLFWLKLFPKYLSKNNYVLGPKFVSASLYKCPGRRVACIILIIQMWNLEFRKHKDIFQGCATTVIWNQKLLLLLSPLCHMTVMFNLRAPF